MTTAAEKALDRTLKFLAKNWNRMGGKCPKGLVIICGECPDCDSPAKKKSPFCRMALQWHKQMEAVDNECSTSN